MVHWLRRNITRPYARQSSDVESHVSGIRGNGLVTQTVVGHISIEYVKTLSFHTFTQITLFLSIAAYMAKPLDDYGSFSHKKHKRFLFT